MHRGERCRTEILCTGNGSREAEARDQDFVHGRRLGCKGAHSHCTRKSGLVASVSRRKIHVSWHLCSGSSLDWQDKRKRVWRTGSDQSDKNGGWGEFRGVGRQLVRAQQALVSSRVVVAAIGNDLAPCVHEWSPDLIFTDWLDTDPEDAQAWIRHRGSEGRVETVGSPGMRSSRMGLRRVNNGDRNVPTAGPPRTVPSALSPLLVVHGPSSRVDSVRLQLSGRGRVRRGSL